MMDDQERFWVMYSLSMFFLTPYLQEHPEITV